MRVFGRENVLVLMFEEAFADPGSTARAVKRVLSFLDADASAVDGIEYRRKHNYLSAPRGSLARFLLAEGWTTSLGKRLLPGELRWFLRDKILSRRVEKPELEARAAGFLRRIYEPEVPRLERLLGRGLPWKVGA
ncbi:MAG: hypothetical protein ACRDSJ_17730 [Rubrobacteraceae bacterium]